MRIVGMILVAVMAVGLVLCARRNGTQPERKISITAEQERENALANTRQVEWQRKMFEKMNAESRPSTRPG